jgi:hypothetical protein
VSLTACGGGGGPSQDQPRLAQEVRSVDNLSAYAWRDFMPGDGDSRLRVSIEYHHGAPAGPDTIVRIDAVRQGTETWSPTSTEIREEADKGIVRCRADGGPLWATGSGIEIDVTYGPEGNRTATIPAVINSTH